MARQFSDINEQKLVTTIYTYTVDYATVQWGPGEDDIVRPQYVTWTKRVPNSGAKINIEVVDNGFVIKAGKLSLVAADKYDVDSHLKDIMFADKDYMMDWEEFVSKHLDDEEPDNYSDVSFKFNTVYKGTKNAA